MTESEGFKVILLGDTGVGKTALVRCQCSEEFTYHIAPTIGTMHVQTVVALASGDVELRLWDTAGQEEFFSLVPMYVRGTDAAILVASVCDPASLGHLQRWNDLLLDQEGESVVLVAINKIDMEPGPGMRHQIESEICPKFSNVVFVSAKTGEGVRELFTFVASELVKTRKPVVAGASEVNIGGKEPDKQCC
jgi:small GTP-binding protein